MVAEYLLANYGCPLLRKLDIDLDWGELSSISHAIRLGTAPSLKSLSIRHISDRGTAMRDLAAAFKAGALSALKTLSFSCGCLTPEPP